MGRHRQYRSDADKQRAYRARKAAELAALHATTGKGAAVAAKLVKVLGMHGSDHAGERAARWPAGHKDLEECRADLVRRPQRQAGVAPMKEIAALPSGLSRGLSRPRRQALGGLRRGKGHGQARRLRHQARGRRSKGSLLAEAPAPGGRQVTRQRACECFTAASPSACAV